MIRSNDEQNVYFFSGLDISIADGISKDLFDTAYNSYIDLYNLGRFIARELRLKVSWPTDVASVTKLCRAIKSNVHILRTSLKDHLEF